MFFHFRKSKELESLEEKLKECSRISISEELKSGMKRNVLRGLLSKKPVPEFHGFESIIERIREISAQIAPNAVFRALLKEKLITLVEFYAVRSFANLPGWFSRHRKLVATVTLSLVIFTAFFNFIFSIPKVEASFKTLIEETNGEVWVMRDGKQMTGSSSFLLKADDTIFTGPNSGAAIRFLDQSIGRMSENTEVKISRLFVNPSNKTQTVVEVNLREGRLWARVVNLIDDLSSFQVRTKNTVAVAKKKAAFDVAATKGKAKVTTLQHRVNFVVETPKKVTETTLVNGFSAELKTETAAAVPQIKQEPSGQPQDQWVAQNLAQDKQYIETVKQEVQSKSKDMVQVLPDSPLYVMKELTQNTQIALTLDDVEKHKKKILAASEKLAEAIIVLPRGHINKARRLLSEFQFLISEVSQWLRDHESTNPAETAEVRRVMAEVLAFHEKNLNIILPTDPVYEAKTVLALAKLSAASSTAEQTQEKIGQAGQKLLEAQDLVEQGDTANAAKQIEAYQETISEVAEEVKNLPADEKAAVVGTLLDAKAEDLKTLAAITTSSAVANTPEPATASTGNIVILGTSSNSSTLTVATSTPAIELTMPEEPAGTTTSALTDTNALPPMAGKELAELVTEVKTDSLEKLREAVLDVQKESSSMDVLRKVEDLKKADVNGKPLLNVTILLPKTLPTANLGKPELPQVRPQTLQ